MPFEIKNVGAAAQQLSTNILTPVRDFVVSNIGDIIVWGHKLYGSKTAFRNSERTQNELKKIKMSLFPRADSIFMFHIKGKNRSGARSDEGYSQGFDDIKQCLWVIQTIRIS